MAGLTQRTYIAAAIILVAGAVIQLTGRAHATGRDEKFMIAKAPVTVAGYQFVDNPKSPGKTYNATEREYDLLKPFGIVPRIYSQGDKAFEVLLISSNTKESFHDQRVCLPGQGNTPTSSEVMNLDVPGRGKIPVVLAHYNSPDRGDFISAYFYRGPGGYYSYPQELSRAMLFQAIMGKQSIDSSYYRFIPQHQGATNKETLDFIKNYLVEADKTSGGFF